MLDGIGQRRCLVGAADGELAVGFGHGGAVGVDQRDAVVVDQVDGHPGVQDLGDLGGFGVGDGGEGHLGLGGPFDLVLVAAQIPVPADLNGEFVAVEAVIGGVLDRSVLADVLRACR